MSVIHSCDPKASFGVSMKADSKKSYICIVRFRQRFELVSSKNILIAILTHIFAQKVNQDYKLPCSILHKILSTKNHQHVGPTIVEYPCPVLNHPYAGMLMYKLIFKVKDVWIIRRHLHVFFYSSTNSFFSIFCLNDVFFFSFNNSMLSLYWCCYVN